MLDDAALDRLRRAVGPRLEHPRYRFDTVIGAGGMGTVYEAFDRLLERAVAIKVLRGPADHADLGSRLSREARLLARLDHPGLVPVHDVGRLEDGRAFYVMRLVRGVRLDEFLRQTPSLSARLRLFLRILDPVGYAHAEGVIHRDLKPANIMVGPFGDLLVLDWGIAKVAGEGPRADEVRAADAEGESTGAGVVMGTPGFMAPEQAAGESARVDRRADVYALGAILRLLLDTDDQGSHPPRPLASICRKAMAERPDQRYPTVTELGADVSRFLDGEPVSAHRESITERVGRLAARHRTAIGLVATYLVVRIALILAGRR